MRPLYISDLTSSTDYYLSTKYFYFGKCLEKTIEYFLKFLSVFESTILPGILCHKGDNFACYIPAKIKLSLV